MPRDRSTASRRAAARRCPRPRSMRSGRNTAIAFPRCCRTARTSSTRRSRERAASSRSTRARWTMRHERWSGPWRARLSTRIPAGCSTRVRGCSPRSGSIRRRVRLPVIRCCCPTSPRASSTRPLRDGEHFARRHAGHPRQVHVSVGIRPVARRPVARRRLTVLDRTRSERYARVVARQHARGLCGRS
jgi:hypothetical protein